MKTPRLIPTLIVAASALLVFKTIGLMTDGGYVLVGTTAAIAEGGGGHGGAAPAAEAGADAGGTTLSDMTMEDASPTLEDPDTTMSMEAPGGEHGGASSHGGAATSEGDAEHAEGDAAHAEGDAAHADAGTAEAAPAGLEPCPPDAATAAPASGHSEAAPAPAADCLPAEAQSDMPRIIDATGAEIPMVDSSVGASQPQLLERLGERREELDARQSDLDMREALVEAAEQRLEQRSEELKGIEARIAALADQQKAAESEQFKSLVAMYETMKPKDAAAIFDALDLDILAQVAQSMSPRKMGPILAQMDPNKAKSLTTLLVTAERSDQTANAAPTDMSALPQIVGQ